MPRFFFNSEDGDCFLDKSGTVLPNLAAARREGVKILGELIVHDPELFLKTESFRVIVQDENRLTLYTIDMSGLTSPAAKR